MSPVAVAAAGRLEPFSTQAMMAISWATVTVMVAEIRRGFLVGMGVAAATTDDALQDQGPGADLHGLVEGNDISITHADAARRHVRTNGPGLVRSMDAVERRAEIECARTQGIVRTARHEVRQVWLAPEHFIGRRPVRPFFFCRNGVRARPCEAGAADADPVADRSALALD